MHQLEADQYPLARPLLESMDHFLVVDSIFEGNTPGHVWVDDPERPTIALMWNRMDALILGGDPTAPGGAARVNQLMTNFILPAARERYIPQLALHLTTRAWKNWMAVVLAGMPAAMASRRYYQYDPLPLPWRDAIPEGYRMAAIDEFLLAEEGLANRDDVLGWVLSFWPSLSDFVATGLGYCLRDDRRIASWCLSVYAAGSQRELGLATAPEERGRGFATLVAAACLEECRERRLTPHWHCWEDNLPSIAVAEKVGFTRPTIYSVYRITV